MREGQQRLGEGAARLGVALDKQGVARMLDYLALLAQWNRAYNLTSIEGIDESVTAHLLDSLSIAPYLAGERIADIGTGAGLPGIPLAIAAPERQFTLVDSRAKKTRFVRHAARDLGLDNVEVVESRVEDYRPETAFDTVTARALASLPRLLELGGHLLAPGGVLLAMKGRNPEAEVRELGPAWRVQGLHRLKVPGLPAERHLVVIGNR